MPPAQITDSGALPAYTKMPGFEPLPGYVLIEPLGRGGFGEVWKCEAPGGLHKAVKFVSGAAGTQTGDTRQFQQEYEAFQQIRAIRHPFLLTLERVEKVGDDLVMVMELADRQLRDQFLECRAAGLPGIPRAELLGYLGEAAEALDVIGAQYGLQHLDVKPANLFLTAGHVKVGDYGLVSKLDCQSDGNHNRGLTPKYVAPEVLRGQVHTRSDQYSLALVYQELLTGAFPYSGRTPQQMMLQHVSSSPDLSGLPESDRAVVGRALSKNPEDRFPSCLDFVRAVLASGPAAPPAGHSVGAPGGSKVIPFRQRQIEQTPGPGELTGRSTTAAAGITVRRGPSGELTQSVTLKTLPPLTVPGRPLPPLVAASRWGAFPPSPSTAPPPPTPAPLRPAADDPPLAEPEPSDRVRLASIRSLLPVARLLGFADTPDAAISTGEFVAAVVETAAAGGRIPQVPGDLGRMVDGGWVCQFPSTVAPQVAPLKLAVVRDYWSLTMEQPDPGRILFRRSAGGGFWGALSGKKAGVELMVQLLRPGRPVGEITITAAVYGSPDKAFVRTAEEVVPKIIADLRRDLGNIADRRKSPRLTASLPVTVHPLRSDGSIEPAVSGRCFDVSTGGIGFTTGGPVGSRYAYAELGGVDATTGVAALVKLVRHVSPQTGHEHVYGGQYRVDL